MSYAYLRLDLVNTVTDPAAQSLLKHFISSLYDEDIIGQCSEYGFTPVPTRVKDIALEGLDKVIIDPNAPIWSVETNTIKGGGQGDFVISGKRRSYINLQSSSFDKDISDLSTTLDSIETVSMNGVIYESENGKVQVVQSDLVFASLAMSAISIFLWFVTFIYLLIKKCC